MKNGTAAGFYSVNDLGVSFVLRLAWESSTMTAEIIQFVPRPKADGETRPIFCLGRKIREERELVPYGGQGIDGMVFTAPDSDSA
jgi:hypothetical protein